MREPIEDIENPFSDICDEWGLDVCEDEQCKRCCATCENYIDSLCTIWP